MRMYDSTKGGENVMYSLLTVQAHCDIIVLANTRSRVDVYSFGSSIIALFSYFDDIAE